MVSQETAVAACCAMAYVWLVVYAGQLASFYWQQQEANCPPQILLADTEDGILWVYGSCRSISINDEYHFSSTGCNLHLGRRIDWMGTGIQVHDDQAGPATPCQVGATHYGVSLGNWTFTGYYQGDRRLGP